jgi:hypothetical protein
MSKNPDQNPQNVGGFDVQGTSELYKFNTSPNTRVALSQKVRLLAPTYGRDGRSGLKRHQLGVVSTFSYDGNSRSTEGLRGIGFGDQLAELVPSVQDNPTISFSRALFYLSNAFQSIGFAGGVDGPVRTVKHTRWPFDMEEQIVFSDIADNESDNSGNGASYTQGIVDVDYSAQNVTDPNVEAFKYAQKKHKAILTYFETCWLHSIGHSVDIGTAHITEEVACGVTDIHDGFSTYGEFLSTGNNPYLNQVASKRFPATR